MTDKRNLEASNAYFAKFVEEVHAHGMKIILDGVFNHCGSFHKWLDREKLYEQQGGYAPGAYVSGESPYREEPRMDMRRSCLHSRIRKHGRITEVMRAGGASRHFRS